MSTKAKSSKPVIAETNPDEEVPFGKIPDSYADKDELCAKELVFDVLSIEYQEKLGFQGADRWFCNVMVYDEDGNKRGEEYLTFAPNDKRDEVMAVAANWLHSGKLLDGYVLKQSGRAFYINKAELQ